MDELQHQQVNGQTQVGEWTLCGPIGVLYDGAMTNSTVYKASATHVRFRKPHAVAVKRVSLQGDAASLAMIRQEYNVLKDLKGSHPHILPMLYFGEMAQEILIVFPFAPEGDLSKRVRMGCECIEEFHARRLAKQLMSALSHMHSQCIVHSDIAPQNVLLTRCDNALIAQLCDFGLSFVMPKGESSCHLGRVQGSHGYIPSEVILLKDVTYAIDLFGLGVIVFQVLGAHNPFYPSSNVRAAVEFDEQCWNPISQEGRAFALRLLDVDPAKRGSSTPSAHEWLAATETDFAGVTRTIQSPQPIPDIRFHTLEASASWSTSNWMRSSVS